MSIRRLKNHVKECIEKTEENNSNLNNEIINMEGMSGIKTRHLINNICSWEESKYLEIGCWKGSLTCSALYNNKLTCMAIDNWSEYGGPKEEFLENFNKYKGNNDATFLEKNCWKIEESSIGRFNIFIYDGDNNNDSHYNSLKKYFEAIDDEFIFLVRDWNLLDIQNQVDRVLKDLELITEFKSEFKTESDSDKDWYNGLGIFILSKKKPDPVEFKQSTTEFSNYI